MQPSSSAGVSPSTSKNKLKTDEYKNLVITYAREKLPRTHTLIEKDGWHNLPPSVHAVR